MRVKELTRVEFLQWLADREGDLPESPERSPPTGGAKEISLVWLDTDTSLRPIIGVRANELREFLAFASTYVGTYVPFTAFFRVIPLEMIDFLPQFQSEGIKEYTLQKALIGTIIAEAALYADNPAIRVNDLSVQACLATSAASAARAVELGYDNSMASLVVERWDAIFSSLVSPTSRVSPIYRSTFWASVLPALVPAAGTSAPSPEIETFLSEVMHSSDRGHDISPGALSPFVADSIGITSMLRASREDRVRALEQILPRITAPGVAQAEAEMVLGFAASQVAEGSFAYLPLILKYQSSHPLATMWFGLFSGLQRKSDALTAGDCLGRRVWRQIKTIPGLLPDITSDMSYEEALLYQAEIRARKVRTDLQGSVAVELLPGVGGVFRIAKGLGGSRSVTPNGISSEQLGRARRLVGELSSLLRGSERSESSSLSPTLFGDNDRPAQPLNRRVAAAKKRTPK